MSYLSVLGDGAVVWHHEPDLYTALFADGRADLITVRYGDLTTEEYTFHEAQRGDQP